MPVTSFHSSRPRNEADSLESKTLESKIQGATSLPAGSVTQPSGTLPLGPKQTLLGRLRHFAGSRAGILLIGALVLGGALLGSPGTAPVHAQGHGSLGNGFVLKVGDGYFAPNQTFLFLPVYLTNASPVTSWEMGLDYDEFMVRIVAVTALGTASEVLHPTVTTSPTAGPITWVRMEYSSLLPLESGQEELVAYLVVELTKLPLTTTRYDVTVLDSESSINTTTPPTTVDGSMDVIVGDLLRIGETEGNLLGPITVGPNTHWLEDPANLNFPTLRVPIEIWNEGPVATLMMGLDYDEFMMCGIDFDQTVISTVAGDDFDVVMADMVAGTVISIDLNGHMIPPGSSQVIGWLLMAPYDGMAGTYPIVPNPTICIFNSDPVPNLLAGSVTYLDEFVRGDASYDGQVNIADAASMLGFLFQTAELVCEDAADANNDGTADIADPVFLLNYLFGSGPQPAAPFPLPAPDPDPGDELLRCLGL